MAGVVAAGGGGGLFLYRRPFSSMTPLLNNAELSVLPPLSLHLSTASSAKRSTGIWCGPRDQNRGPLARGRLLSTEAMLAIQSLKRSPNLLAQTTSRLLKADLLAVLKELQRQDQCHLALQVFGVVRKEVWYKTDFGLYAEMVTALSRNGMTEEIDSLIADALQDKFETDNRGIARLVRALIGAGNAEGAVSIYEMTKGSGFLPDDFLFRVLIRGLKRLGKQAHAAKVMDDFREFSKKSVLVGYEELSMAA
ncbi:hypothetical protein AMTRI_Chr08g205610 [Amborella trichopoda]|uniref:Pentacotripeptide-repeat region of PRORP domain-containing protein n=1 Tax=Amborella trichopoda TaxID=13333 RepID=W1PWN5_AMBTC|nr:pentatricopeptide repeat-containing protein At1g62350 [Amborella trichopoda]ERN12186.1 hypothetical protein AMTR_s00034p00130400 [Amborella trichopoda]|eukprot:XP_006850605.1 pentatricopeptide repeat-containing protein At1g62350 [Amborella trichopoda]